MRIEVARSSGRWSPLYRSNALFGLALSLATPACGSASQPLQPQAGSQSSAGQSGKTAPPSAAGGHDGSAGKLSQDNAGAVAPAADGGGGAALGGIASPDDRPAAGNPDGHCSIPADAQLEDVSHPDTVVGTGTAASCTSDAFVAAVAKGGVITFDCGAQPITLTLTQTAKVFNDKGPKVVIDGGGKITLSGADKLRILYQNTCDKAQVWTSSHCDDQPDPQLTVQNLSFEHGWAKGLDPAGGGAIFASGGRLKIINARFFNNSCDDTGPDVGGAAVRALQQSGGMPLYVVNSTFGGRADLGNVCSNGAGLSSIGVSYTVLNSLFSDNQAIGQGANPAASGTPGGGSGGAIYNDGNTYTLTVCGSLLERNSANEGGGAIFFVSNDRSGSLVISDSTLRSNPSAKFETQGYPGIYVLDQDNKPSVTNSTLSK
jgi:hypothetical protein